MYMSRLGASDVIRGNVKTKAQPSTQESAEVNPWD